MTTLPMQEILDLVRSLPFSRRKKFFDALDERTKIPGIGKVAWPAALLVLSRDDWNIALLQAGMEIVRHAPTCPVSKSDFVPDLAGPDQCNCDFGKRLAKALNP